MQHKDVLSEASLLKLSRLNEQANPNCLLIMYTQSLMSTVTASASRGALTVMHNSRQMMQTLLAMHKATFEGFILLFMMQCCNTCNLCLFTVCILRRPY